MAEARALLVSEPLKFGMLTLFLPVVAVVSQNLAIRLLTSLLWVAILVSTFLVNANGYKYAKRLVEQTREEQ